MTRVKQILRILQKGDLLIRVLLQRVQRIAVDKSVEFSYDELANASDNFSTAYKIGQGGFASVYYGEFRGEKAATKKMDMQSTKEFLAELKVLAHVHHLNLVNSLLILIYYLFLLNYNLFGTCSQSMGKKINIMDSWLVKLANFSYL
uniref:LysM type receptor kinase n=1 Tax=Solanum tuberosum TaxID=4113 RepID=M0ZLP5_SOLTU